MGIFGFGKNKPAGRGSAPRSRPESSGLDSIIPRELRGQLADQVKLTHGGDEPVPVPSPTYEALDAHWASLGEVDPDIIGYQINPMFLGSPAWPNTRQGYRIIRTPSSLILASDGMSDVDPRNPGGGPGFGCETWLESPDLLDADFARIRSSWQFFALEVVTRNIADQGGLGAALQRFGVLSMDLPPGVLGPDVPASLVNRDGSVGVLLGLRAADRPARVETPVGPVDLVAVTVIPAAELAVIMERGAQGRADVAARREAEPGGHLTLA